MSSRSQIESGDTCPNCNYDLSGLFTDDQCPECGVDIDIHDPDSGIKRFSQPQHSNALFMAICTSLIFALAWPLLALLLRVPAYILLSVWIAAPLTIVFPLYLFFAGYKGTAVTINWTERTVVFERSFRRKGLLRSAFRKRYHKCPFDNILKCEVMVGRAYSVMRVITSDGSATLPDTIDGFESARHYLEDISRSTPDAPLIRTKLAVYVMCFLALLVSVAAALVYHYYFSDPSR